MTHPPCNKIGAGLSIVGAGLSIIGARLSIIGAGRANMPSAKSQNIAPPRPDGRGGACLLFDCNLKRQSPHREDESEGRQTASYCRMQKCASTYPPVPCDEACVCKAQIYCLVFMLANVSMVSFFSCLEIEFICRYPCLNVRALSPTLLSTKGG